MSSRGQHRYNPVNLTVIVIKPPDYSANRTTVKPFKPCRQLIHNITGHTHSRFKQMSHANPLGEKFSAQSIIMTNT